MTEEAVIWTDPVTGQQLINAREYNNRPVWLLDIGKYTDEEQEAMFERYRKWKETDGE